MGKDFEIAPSGKGPEISGNYTLSGGILLPLKKIFLKERIYSLEGNLRITKLDGDKIGILQDAKGYLSYGDKTKIRLLIYNRFDHLPKQAIVAEKDYNERIEYSQGSLPFTGRFSGESISFPHHIRRHYVEKPFELEEQLEKKLKDESTIHTPIEFVFQKFVPKTETSSQDYSTL